MYLAQLFLSVCILMLLFFCSPMGLYLFQDVQNHSEGKLNLSSGAHAIPKDLKLLIVN